MSKNTPASTPSPAKTKDSAPTNVWKELTPGLSLGHFQSPQASSYGDSTITIARVDPKILKLVLVSASDTKDKKTQTAKDWAEQQNLLAAINASMYQTDYLTSVHHMETKGRKNNPRKLREKSVLVFDPKKKSLPEAQIMDAACENLETDIANYDTQIESIRMLSCDGTNVWKQQDRQWSHAVIGEDKQGRILFIHCRSPYSTHDFVEILKKLPLDLVNLQYAEGGPETQLYVNAGGVEEETFGSFETGFLPEDSNASAWPVPNVIGVQKR